MGYSAKVGSFNIDTTKTAGQTQAISGLGFQPKIVLLWWGGRTATSDGVGGQNINTGFGAAISSTSRACLNVFSVDAGARSDTATEMLNDCCIKTRTAGISVDGIADVSSLDADGFTLVMDDQFANAYRISYLALGGTDLSNVNLGAKAMAATTGNFATTGVGFQPDALLFLSARSTSMPSAVGVGQFCLGMATGASNQGVVAGYSEDNAATMITGGYGYSGECIANVASTSATDHRCAFVSMDADGFTLNKLEGSSQIYFIWIALKGGQYNVGSLTTRTDGNDITVSGLAFQPVATLFASANRALSTQDTASANFRISMGAATSTSNRAAAATSDEDALADSETAAANYDSAVYANVVDDAAVGLMDIKSIDSGGFTAIMDDADPSGCFVTYLTIGAAATVTTKPWYAYGQQ